MQNAENEEKRPERGNCTGIAVFLQHSAQANNRSYCYWVPVVLQDAALPVYFPAGEPSKKHLAEGYYKQ